MEAGGVVVAVVRLVVVVAAAGLVVVEVLLLVVEFAAASGPFLFPPPPPHAPVTKAMVMSTIAIGRHPMPIHTAGLGRRIAQGSISRRRRLGLGARGAASSWWCGAR